MKLCLNLGESDWRLPIHAAALQQSWFYGASIAALGRQVLRVGICSDAGAQLGIAQIVTRRISRFGTLGLISRGPIWTQPQPPEAQAHALRLIRRALPGQGLRMLLVTPEADAPSILPMISTTSVAEVALSDPDHMRSALRGKWRNRLVKGERSDLAVTLSQDPGVLAHLIARDQNLQKRHKYRNLPAPFLLHWARLNPTGFHIFRAMQGKDAVAEMLFLDHAPGATYHIGWTSGTGRALSAHHLILWRAMTHYAALGRLRLDLGALDTVSAPWLARFKLGAGAHLRRIGQSGLVLPRPRLKAFCAKPEALN